MAAMDQVLDVHLLRGLAASLDGLRLRSVPADGVRVAFDLLAPAPVRVADRVDVVLGHGGLLMGDRCRGGRRLVKVPSGRPRVKLCRSYLSQTVTSI
jgi:hypothetical protein